MSGFSCNCPLCGSKMSAETRVVLDDKAKAHLAECTIKTKKKTDADVAAAAQGSLFGPDPKR